MLIVINMKERHVSLAEIKKTGVLEDRTGVLSSSKRESRGKQRGPGADPRTPGLWRYYTPEVTRFPQTLLSTTAVRTG